MTNKVEQLKLDIKASNEVEVELKDKVESQF